MVVLPSSGISEYLGWSVRFFFFILKIGGKNPIWQKLGAFLTPIFNFYFFGDVSVAEGNTTFFFGPN